MITGDLKSKVDLLWNTFWSGGLTNPLTVIEQITYLMFIHDLDEVDTRKAKDAEMLEIPYKSMFEGTVVINGAAVDASDLRWSKFRNFEPQKMFDTVSMKVFPFIKTLNADKNSAFSKYMSDAVFLVPNAQKFTKIVDSMDDIFTFTNGDLNSDTRGDLYEYLLSKIETAGVNGQFRTPRHIVKMVIDLMQPKPADVICDPACGTCGFLVTAGEYLKKNYHDEIFLNRAKREYYYNEMFSGFDTDPSMLRISAMNMMTAGIENPQVQYLDSLSESNANKDRFSLIMTNPPFAGSLDNDIVAPDLLKVCKTKKTELLFLALFVRMLKVGGRCASVVPEGVLFGSSNAHKAIRKELIEHQRLEAVISMPSGVFKPYAGVSTAVLIFTKTNHGGTDKVWFYDMKADGFSLDDKRSPAADNDIPDILKRFANLKGEEKRARSEQSFLVPVAEIVENDYDLSVNKYKEVIYEKVEYRPVKEILGEVEDLEGEIAKGICELKGLLK